MSEFNPQVGDQCHWTLYTDVKPMTVIARNGNTVTVAENLVEITKAPVMVPGGFAAVCVEPPQVLICNDYTSRKPMKFSKRKNGRRKLAGSRMSEPGDVLCAGWHYHYDYGF
jgi:hypothetical protein